MKVIEEFFKPVLEKLYSVYPSFVDLERLRKEVIKKETTYDQAKGVCLYLADKGWVVEGPSTPESRRWRIAALGIDFLEGDLLTADPGELVVVIREKEDKPCPLREKELKECKVFQEKAKKAGVVCGKATFFLWNVDLSKNPGEQKPVIFLDCQEKCPYSI